METRREIRALVRLAAPAIAAQVGTMMLGIVDTWMVGRIGARELGAVALADTVMFGTMIFGMGLVMGLDPIVSQAHGAGDGPAAGRALQRAIVLGVLVTIPLTFVWFQTRPLLRLLGQADDLAAIGGVYARAQVWALAPFLVFHALRQYLQCRGKMMAPLWIILFANLFNAGFNEVLIFGRLGFPALGVYGAGLATGLTRSFVMVALLVVIFAGRMHVGAWVPWSRRTFRWSGLREILKHGIAIGGAWALEVWAFSASTLLAGRISESAVAAHAVVLRLASLAFMVPLGISIAATTRVGNLIGARKPDDARRAAWVALAMGAAVMTLSATLFVTLRGVLGTIFTDDAQVLALAAGVFPIAAAFQLFDGTQVVGAGILRGMGATRPVAVFNFVGYYLLALPLAWWLAWERGLGLRGLWWGLALGLAVVACCLVGFVAARGPGRGPRAATAS